MNWKLMPVLLLCFILLASIQQSPVAASNSENIPDDSQENLSPSSESELDEASITVSNPSAGDNSEPADNVTPPTESELNGPDITEIYPPFSENSESMGQNVTPFDDNVMLENGPDLTRCSLPSPDPTDDDPWVCARVRNNDDDQHTVYIYVKGVYMGYLRVGPNGDSVYSDLIYVWPPGVYNMKIRWYDHDDGAWHSQEYAQEVTWISVFFFEIPRIVPPPRIGYVYAQIYNADDDQHDVYVYLDGAYKGYVKVPSETTRYTSYYEVPVGYHTMKIKWYDEDDASWHENDITQYVYKTQYVKYNFEIPPILPQVKPDLVVTDISCSITHPPLSDPELSPRGDFVVKVKNQGEEEAPASYLGFYIDRFTSYGFYINEFTDSYYVPRLSPGSTYDVTFSYTFDLQADYLFKAVADARKEVDESDETNNERTKGTTVEFILPDLEVTNISYSSSKPSRDAPDVYPGDVVNFTVELKNSGRTAPGFQVDFYVRGSRVGRIDAPSISSGSTRNITFEYRVGESINYNVKAIADSTDFVLESDETNNEGSASVPVRSISAPYVQWSRVEPEGPVEMDTLYTISINVKNPNNVPLNITVTACEDEPTEAVTKYEDTPAPVKSQTKIIPGNEDETFTFTYSHYWRWLKPVEEDSIRHVLDWIIPFIPLGELTKLVQAGHSIVNCFEISGKALPQITYTYNLASVPSVSELEPSYQEVTVTNEKVEYLGISWGYSIAAGVETDLGYGYAALAASLYASAWFTFGGTLPAAVVASEFSAFYFALEVNSLLKADRYMAWAYDPDFNYKEVVLPEAVSIPELDKLPEGPAKEAAKRAFILLSNLEARQAAWNKYQGARISADSDWMLRQLSTTQNYANLVQADYQVLKELIESVFVNLQESLKKLTFPITEDEIQTMQEQIGNEGLPPPIVNAFKEVGYTNEDIATIVEIIQNVPASSYVREGVFDVTLDDNEVQVVKEVIKRRGLLQMEEDILRRFGYTDDDIIAVVNSICYVPDNIVVNYNQIILDLIEESYSTSQEFVYKLQDPALLPPEVEKIPAPTLSVTYSPVEPTYTETVTFTITSTDERGVAQTNLYVDGINVATWQGGGTFTYVGGPYSPGTHTYSAMATNVLDYMGGDPTIGTKSFIILADITPPVSTVDNIRLYWRNEVPFVITSTATDDLSGVENVALWYRYSPDNTTWGDWSKFSVDNDEPYEWDFVPKNDGYYEFYTIATDKAGNIEVAPENAEAWAGVDTVPPESSVDPIEPYWQNSGTVPFEVSTTASDNLSGVASVELFYRYSSDNIVFGSWVFCSTDNEEPWSWTFEAPEGDGYYDFHSIVTDEASNVEEEPEVADTVCGVDTVPPESSVDRIEPYWQNAEMVPFDITATALDLTPPNGSTPSGMMQVKLHYRYSTDNLIWGEWMSYEIDNDLPYFWTFDAPEGNGYYEFCTVATDVAINIEPVPDQADLNLGVDTTPPISSVDPIESYWQESTLFTVSVTALDALSGVADVELYYQSSIDNVNWSEWKLLGIDNVAPYEWSFTAPDGYGLYQFHSVATDVAGNVENAPETADAKCCVVIPAEIDIDPNTLNLKSQGRWITAYIELPGVYDLAGIDLATITLDDVVPTELHPTEIADHDNDGIPDLMIKFDRSAVQSLVSVGEIEIVITGKWHAVLFKGSDTIRVIEPGRGQRGNRPEAPPGQSDEHPGKQSETPPGQSGEHPSQGQGETGGGQGKTKNKDKGGD